MHPGTETNVHACQDVHAMEVALDTFNMKQHIAPSKPAPGRLQAKPQPDPSHQQLVARKHTHQNLSNSNETDAQRMLKQHQIQEAERKKLSADMASAFDRTKQRQLWPRHWIAGLISAWLPQGAVQKTYKCWSWLPWPGSLSTTVQLAWKTAVKAGQIQAQLLWRIIVTVGLLKYMLVFWAVMAAGKLKVQLRELAVGHIGSNNWLVKKKLGNANETNTHSPEGLGQSQQKALLC